MGYQGETLESLAGPLEQGVERFALATTANIGDDLKTRVAHWTPVAKQTAAVRASFSSLDDWIGSRRGRHPGELKGSWQVGEVTVTVRGFTRVYTVPVFTRDKVAPFVEYPTRPHLILPRRPGGVLAIPTAAGIVFARAVHHPGTQGSYMMATAIAEEAVAWQRQAAEDWRAETERIFSHG